VWPARVSLTNGAGSNLSRRFSPAQFSHNEQVNINSDNATKNVILQCFDTVGWAAERASGHKKTEWWGFCVVIYLEHRHNTHLNS